MSVKLLLNYVLSIDTCLLLVALGLVIHSGLRRRTVFFAALLAMYAIHLGIDTALMYHRKALGISLLAATSIFRYAGWITEVAGIVLVLLSVYSVFQSLMEPMPGLQRMGRLLFRWVGAVAACLGCVVMFGPHQSSPTYLEVFFSQFQEGVAVLTLCLLLAVTFATRPLGLSKESRLFGTLLGLGILSAASLVASTWFSATALQSPYSPSYLIGGFACLLASSVWIAYFIRPEPARRMITLPTTSPFFFWNSIAEALGDAPGEVAVAGISPDMFAPAELLAFTSAPRPPAPVIEMPQPQAAQR